MGAAFGFFMGSFSQMTTPVINPVGTLPEAGKKTSVGKEVGS